MKAQSPLFAAAAQEKAGAWQGTDIRVMETLLNHTDLGTTAIYPKVGKKYYAREGV